MNKKEAISQLESFIADCKEFVSIEPTEKDVQALEIAMAALKETAQEVPVQEQSILRNLKASITINGLDVIKNISTDSSLKVDTICTDKTSVEINLFKS